MISVSVQLFWAILNTLDSGESIHHAAIPAYALWHVHGGRLHAEVQLEDGARREVRLPADHWLLMPPLLSRTITALTGTAWTSLGLTALSHNRDLLTELASLQPWQPAEGAAPHGLALISALAGPRTAGALYSLEREALTRALFAWLWSARAARSLEQAARGDGPAWLWQAQDRAEAEPSISIARLAHEAGYSDAAFRREWRRHTGQSPREWLQARRIELATALLNRTDVPIAEVAHRSGFETAGQFTRAFKASTGVTPQTFRMLRRENAG